VEQASRYRRRLSVIMTDLDRFKSVNDRYGHLVGDEVLRIFVEVTQDTVRSTDWVARYGGEEFVIVLPETPLEGALAVAEKVRHRCASAPFNTEAGELAVTSSFGVASLEIIQDAAIVGAADLLRDADTALYRSKREGRNRVTAADKR
jgi:diguanylate cyclase (GGDEF)-like protein